MSKIKYASDKFSEHMARALGRDLPISTKHGVNICKMIRGKTTVVAKKLLEEVISMKRAVPYKRYYRELSHKRKIGPGRFPISTASEFLKLVKSVEANAQVKSLNASNLIIIHISSHIASRPWRFGRKRGRKAKRSHVQIIVEEIAQKESDKKGGKTDKTAKPKDSNINKSEPKSENVENNEKKDDVSKEEAKISKKQKEMPASNIKKEKKGPDKK